MKGLGQRLISYFDTETRQRLLARLGHKPAIWLRCLMRGQPIPRWGNFRRTQPFSESFGLDRGVPLDRYYIDQFFELNRELITGDVLEIQSPIYTERFGSDLNRSESVDINPYFEPTYVCDLARADEVIPCNRYDCFLLPQTFQHVRHLDAGLRNVLRVVKPGGVILATASCMNPLTPKLPEYWRFTQSGWKVKLSEAWPSADIKVEGHGNSLAAVAAVMGLSWQELRTEELDVRDHRFPVIVTIKARVPDPEEDRHMPVDQGGG